MRFLCFHGRGMNGEYFKRQTTKIRHALGDSHEFVFVNGPFPYAHPLLAGEGMDGTFRFLGSTAAEQKTFRHDILRLIETLGPFDGVMGYSEGGGVAAWLLAMDGMANPQQRRLKCGILFGAASIDETDTEVADAQFMQAVPGEVLIKVPTAHIWSPHADIDTDNPTSVRALFPGIGRQVAAMCEPSLREEYRHEYGHIVPGADSDEGLRETLRVIDRTIERVRELEEDGYWGR